MTERASPRAHPAALGHLQAFHQAAAFHAQGRLWEAEQLYEIALKADGRHFESLYRLGLIRLQQGRFADAAQLFRRGAKVEKNSADAQFHFGVALSGLGRAEDAIQRYEKALALKPNFPEAHNNFGYALQLLGRHEEAAAHYEKALGIQPAYAEARANLGNALQMLGRSEEAIVQYEKAIALRPNYAEAHLNLGNVLGTLGHHEEAIAHYERALAIRPNYAEARHSLGNALGALGQYEEAITQYRIALGIRSDYAEAHFDLGNAVGALGRHEEALVHYDKMLALRPTHLEALNGRGHLLITLKRLDDAMTTFERALSIKPDNSHAFNGLARCAGAACDWSRSTSIAARLTAHVAEETLAINPFTFLGYCDEPSLQLACAKAYVRSEIPELPPRLWRRTVWRNDKIRIAYVASGFYQHPTAYLMAELIELHDRSRFEVVGISLGFDDKSDIRARLVRAFDRFHDVRSKSDHEVATLIHDMRTDIAIDRSGYTTDTRPRIFAHRPAPIQASYIGFPGTLGANFYDYVIADSVVLPLDQQPFFTEKIVHLPECYLVNDSTRVIAERTPTRREMGLPDRGFVFCCFNNNNKLTAPIFDIWMRLLARVEGSVLWLYKANPAAETNLRKEAAARGIDPARLVFAARIPNDEHLGRHRFADLFLDTLPYNAHTTASDALWTGLPLVTCRGKSFAGRVAASLLEAVGLPDLVTDNLEEYEALALRLATEPPLLRDFRQRLERNRLSYPLFDTDRYRRHIEAAYTKMWEIWQRGESPHSFAVEPMPAKE